MPVPSGRGKKKNQSKLGGSVYPGSQAVLISFGLNLDLTNPRS